MKIYVVKIKPLTGFGSLIKGDSLFGQICWQIFYDPHIFKIPIQELIKEYDESPFVIVSSAYPEVDGKIYLKRPSMPLQKLFKIKSEDFVEKRKNLKKRGYFVFEQLLKPLNEISYEALNFFMEDSQTRCTISRITGTTGEAPFTPYAVDKIYFNCNLVIFAGLRDDIEVEAFLEIIKRIGKYGYGKDATAGYGKFNFVECSEIDLMSLNSNFNALYTLSPSVPKKEEVRNIYFTPFIRFGRHGSIFAKTKNPFKNPVIFADESAVIFPSHNPAKPYIGQAIRNLSKVCPEAVTQGYSLVLPVEVRNDL